MTATLRIRLWCAFLGLLIFTIGEVAYTEMFLHFTSADIFAQYHAVDAQLPLGSVLAKYVFSLSEALCFTILCYFFMQEALADVKLRVAHSAMFSLAMVNLGDALIGCYIMSFDFIVNEYKFALAAIVLVFIELYRQYKRG